MWRLYVALWTPSMAFCLVWLVLFLRTCSFYYIQRIVKWGFTLLLSFPSCCSSLPSSHQSHSPLLVWLELNGQPLAAGTQHVLFGAHRCRDADKRVCGAVSHFPAFASHTLHEDEEASEQLRAEAAFWSCYKNGTALWCVWYLMGQCVCACVCVPCLIRFHLEENLLQLTVWENTTSFGFGLVPLLFWKTRVIKPSVHLADAICSLSPARLTSVMFT